MRSMSSRSWSRLVWCKCIASAKDLFLAVIMYKGLYDSSVSLRVKLKGMDENRTSSSIVHTKYLDRNRNYLARLEYLKVRGGNDPAEEEPDQMETLGSTILGVNEDTGLPMFPPFGVSELTNRPFLRARLGTLLRSDLWHHLIEHRDLHLAMVSPACLSSSERSRLNCSVIFLLWL